MVDPLSKTQPRLRRQTRNETQTIKTPKPNKKYCVDLRLEGVGAGEVLKRVSVDVTSGVEEGNDNEEVLLKLLQVVLEGKDEKARREMKGLVSKMLRETSSQNDLRKESLYSACDGCLQLLHQHFLRAAEADLQDVGQIAR